MCKIYCKQYPVKLTYFECLVPSTNFNTGLPLGYKRISLPPKLLHAVPLWSHSPPTHCPSNHCSVLHHYRLSFHVCQISGISQCTTWWDWLLSLSIMSSRYISIVCSFWLLGDIPLCMCLTGGPFIHGGTLELFLFFGNYK